MTHWSVVDTKQSYCYRDVGVFPDKPSGQPHCPAEGEDYYGQDAQYTGNTPKYVLSYHRVGSDWVTLVEDRVTGLTWMSKLGRTDSSNKEPDRFTWAGAKTLVDDLNKDAYGGYTDWRLPSVKELYSLIIFTGSSATNILEPYIDNRVFEFRYGDPDADGIDDPDDKLSWRAIDAQCWTSTEYAGFIMDNEKGAFGVNFADGRIKCYPTETKGYGGRIPKHFVRCVRGDRYGINRFIDNENDTVTDAATGLMWTKYDSGSLPGHEEDPMDWKHALAYAENLNFAGYTDWRLPNAKELQSIVDYSKAPSMEPGIIAGPAINSMFRLTDNDEWCWTSTTHTDDANGAGSFAVYICFGEATGYTDDHSARLDMHGAGAQRSDPKSEQAVKEPIWWMQGFGPQNDVIRVYNYALCVRDAVYIPKPNSNTDTIEPDSHSHRD